MPVRNKPLTVRSELFDRVDDYFSLDLKYKAMGKKITAEKDSLKKLVTKKGVEDENGSKVLKVVFGKTAYEVTNTCVTTYVAKVDAVDKMKKDPQLKKLVQTVQVIDMELLKVMVADGKISAKVANSLLSEETSFRFTVKKR